VIDITACSAITIRQLKAVGRVIVFVFLWLYLLRLPQPHAF
jgi:hypothetical protein